MMRNSLLLMVLIFLALALIACASESAAGTATAAPTASPITEPPPTEVLPTEQPGTSVPAVQAFEDQLMQALSSRDAAQLLGLMGDTFMIAGWLSEGTTYTPHAAVEQLQNNYLGEYPTLAFDPNKDLVALLDGTDPLSILGPGMNDPRAMFVEGWGLEGKDEAIMYIAHQSDGTPIWYGVLIGPGGFMPSVAGAMLDSATTIAIPEASIAVRMPPGQMLVKNSELFRRGSFASYDFVLPVDAGYPYLAEIQFFSRDSIEGFLSRCAGAEHPCFFGDYPDIERYDEQKAAFERMQDYKGFRLQEFGGRPFFVSQHACVGAPCVVREYTTFAGDTKVDVWAMMDAAVESELQAAQADALFSQLVVQDDWAGIGAQPGPLFTLSNPGLTLRHPLGWTVREETGGEDSFVARSISFVPPAFAASDQPQVPTIDLFVYSQPLTDTLAAWLAAYSAEVPFGSAVGPETHFFGVQDMEAINTASLLALQFTHDVMGLTAHELLFAVGPTVAGLSYVDFGVEDLGPAYRQMQSSLVRAATAAPAKETKVRTILALAAVPIYRGPDETYQQIGQVFEGQVALVTGASEDSAWWRVICPNDTIGDCWVSADSQRTQPTDPPGGFPNAALITTWNEYRDERYGYGLAVPCHWELLPPPLEGNFATLTVRSFDEEFRLKNSIKGEWKDGRWPTGAIKMDLTVVEGVPPEQPLAEFVGDLLQQGESVALEHVGEAQVGSRDAIAARTTRSGNPLDRHTTYALRLAPDKILLVSILPEDAWRSGDAQAILNSIAPTSGDAIQMPSYPPGPALIDVPEACID